MDNLKNILLNAKTIIPMSISVCLLCITYFNWGKTKMRFLIKCIIDCFYPIWSYMVILITHYNITATNPGNKYALYLCILGGTLLAGMHFFCWVCEFIGFHNLDNVIIKKLPFAIILINMFIELLMLSSIVNYICYILFPDQFLLPDGLSFGAIGFEFMYYTFSLLITYSSASIEAIGIFTKSVQMLEIAICYVCIGICLMQLIDKLKS